MSLRLHKFLVDTVVSTVKSLLDFITRHVNTT